VGVYSKEYAREIVSGFQDHCCVLLDLDQGGIQQRAALGKRYVFTGDHQPISARQGNVQRIPANNLSVA